MTRGGRGGGEALPACLPARFLSSSSSCQKVPPPTPPFSVYCPLASLTRHSPRLLFPLVGVCTVLCCCGERAGSAGRPLEDGWRTLPPSLSPSPPSLPSSFSSWPWMTPLSLTPSCPSLSVSGGCRLLRCPPPLSLLLVSGGLPLRRRSWVAVGGPGPGGRTRPPNPSSRPQQERQERRRRAHQDRQAGRQVGTTPGLLVGLFWSHLDEGPDVGVARALTMTTTHHSPPPPPCSTIRTDLLVLAVVMG